MYKLGVTCFTNSPKQYNEIDVHGSFSLLTNGDAVFRNRVQDGGS